MIRIIRKKSQKEDIENKRVVFSYSTDNLKGSDRIRFFYALKGRNEKPGLIDELGAEKLGGGVLMVSDQGSKEIKDFFKEWKVGFREIPVLVRKVV